MISMAMLLLSSVAIHGSEPVLPSASSRLVAAAFVENLSSNGVDPNSVSLTWTESTDPNFVSYSLEKSTNSPTGPWTDLAEIESSSVVEFAVKNLYAGTTNWWQIILANTTGSVYSNVLTVVQPSLASLTYTLPNATSVNFSWNDDAHYGGYISFQGYLIMESVNGGPTMSAAIIYSKADQNKLLDDLSPSTNYSFYLNTTDQCLCSPTQSIDSDSNIVAFTTPSLVFATAHASRATADVGQSVSFSCSGSGGSGSVHLLMELRGRNDRLGCKHLACVRFAGLADRDVYGSRQQWDQSEWDHYNHRRLVAGDFDPYLLE